eukprot:6570172-Lingulodinium_polyedra.AAC.1
MEGFRRGTPSRPRPPRTPRPGRRRGRARPPPRGATGRSAPALRPPGAGRPSAGTVATPAAGPGRPLPARPQPRNRTSRETAGGAQGGPRPRRAAQTRLPSLGREPRP